MVRKTKQDALATRDLILDTAECVFQRRGVAATSLQEIAQAAGLTRGAIYWHFQNKADVFAAMMQRVVLPLEHTLERPTVAWSVRTRWRCCAAVSMICWPNWCTTRRFAGFSKSQR